MFASTTVSEAQSTDFLISTNSIEAPTPLPERAQVSARTANVLNEAKPDALSILQLKQGDQVDVLGRENGYAKVRFRLEGDFPVEGFILEGALSSKLGAESLAAGSQAYEKSGATAPEMEAKELPRAPLTEQPKIDIQPRGTLDGRSTAQVEESKPWLRQAGPWVYEGHGFVGFTFLEEAFTTKVEATQVYATEPFLKYEMQGVTLAARGRIGYKFNKLEVGGYGSYDLTFFRGSVPTASATFNPGINKTNVQALMHELKVGPYVRYPFLIAKGWSVRPELRILPSVNLFSTNQLKSFDNVSPGVPGQAVLYSTTNISVMAELAPEVSMPFDLILTPKVGATFFTILMEGQTVNSSAGVALADADKLRTGSPKSPGLLLHYGASLAWNAKRIGAETINVALTYAVTDVSKKFGGLGNRAGVKMIDTKSSSTSTFMGLGIEYLF